jgi:peroxiredoxin Q/BCP
MRRSLVARVVALLLGSAVPAALLAPALACAGEPAGPRLSEGTPAPDFTAPASDGSTVRLSALKGKVVVLYFYPKDDTPGCTVEAKSFRDDEAELKSLGVVLLGVSRDDLDSHRRFVTKYGLAFPLLADPDGAIHDAYGAWKPGSVFGRTALGVDRSTFVIDRQGVVRKAWHGVDPDGHAAQVVDFIKGAKL